MDITLYTSMRKAAVTLAAAITLAMATPATAADYELNVKPFEELQVVNGINVTYRCNTDSAGYVRFSCDPDISSMVLFSNNKNKLKIELSDEITDAQRQRLPTVTVFSVFLSKVENSGDSTVYVDTPSPAATFKARIVGNGTLIARGLHATTVEGKIATGHGHLVLAGEAQTIKLNNTGTGTIEAGTIKATTGRCSIYGTGSVDCWVTNELTVMGLGSGKIYLKGSPTTKNRTLGIKVIPVQ